MIRLGRMRGNGVCTYCSGVEPKTAANEDARSQTASAFEPAFGALVTKGLVHPMAGAAFLHAGETNALDFKFPPDQRSQVCAPHKNIAARRLRPGLRKIQFTPHGVEHLQRKQSDLTFVIFLKPEIAVAADAASGHALDLVRFDDRMVSGRPAVVADKVVAWRSKQMGDTNHAVANDFTPTRR